MVLTLLRGAAPKAGGSGVGIWGSEKREKRGRLLSDAITAFFVSKTTLDVFPQNFLFVTQRGAKESLCGIQSASKTEGPSGFRIRAKARSGKTLEAERRNGRGGVVAKEKLASIRLAALDPASSAG